MKITNEILYQEILHIKEHTGSIEKHLEKLNGKVGNHDIDITAIKTRQGVVWAVLGALGTGLISLAIALFT